MGCAQFCAVPRERQGARIGDGKSGRHPAPVRPGPDTRQETGYNDSPVRRIPFTLSLALTILVTTAVTGTLLRRITAPELVRWGVSAADLAHGRWLQLFFATFQILDPYLALSMLASVLALVGACEYRIGTPRTVFVYALAQITGFLAIILVGRLFAATGSRWGEMLVSEHNVGASAGAVGTMGAWLMAFPRPLRTWSIALCAAFLIAAFGGDVHPWDVAHAASFVLGLGMGAWLLRGRRARGVHKFSAHPGTQKDRRSALAWVAVVVGLFCLMAPLALVDGMTIPEMMARITPRALDAMRWVFFVIGIALIGAAPLVRNGDARGHALALVAGVVSCVILWQPGAPGVEHVLAILLVTGLVVWRRDCDALRAQPDARAGTIVVLCALAFALLGFVALREHFVPPLGGAGMLRVALLRLRFLPPPLPNWNSPGAAWFLQALPLVLYGAIGLAIPMFVRSGIYGNPKKSEGSAGSSTTSG